MPNKDGTGPLGQGAGTGRLKGSCAADRGNASNNPGKRQGRRNGGGGGNGPRSNGGNGGRGRGLNNPNNPQDK